MQIEKNLNSQARKRLELLFDDSEYTEIGSYVKEKDNLTGVITAFGTVYGTPVYAFSQDKTVENGAVGAAQAEKIKKIFELAAKTGVPVVGIHDSNGAFIDGSAKSLSAYGEMLNVSSQISGVVPQISVIAGSCVGCAALLAASSDFIIMSENGEIGMSTLCEKSDKTKLVSAVCKSDEDAINKTRDLISILPMNNLEGPHIQVFSEPAAEYTGDFASIASAVCDANSVVELSENTGKASYTALATISGQTVGIVATNKTNDKLTSEDTSKIARFVRTCDAFAIPVITFVDTEGFDKEGIDGVKALTQLSASYSEATTAKISIITGKCIGSSFIALAGKNVSADFTFAFENASIAPMEPLAAVEFLWHDKLAGAADITAKRNELANEYLSTLASAESATNDGAVDDIIAPADTRSTIVSALHMLEGKRVQKLPKKHNNIPF